MTARALAYIAIAATMLAGSVTAQQPLPEPDLLLAQRAPAPVPRRDNPLPPQPAPAIQPPAPGPDGPPLPAPGTSSPSGPRPLRENQSINVRTEVTVTDERPGVPPIKKTVSMVTSDGLFGSVRSQTAYSSAGTGMGNAPFNVDATPVILADGKVHVRLTLQYDVVPPQAPPEGIRFQGTSIRESLALVLENGKPLVVVQSTDPVSDRKVSVEIKATILK